MLKSQHIIASQILILQLNKRLPTHMISELSVHLLVAERLGLSLLPRYLALLSRAHPKVTRRRHLPTVTPMKSICVGSFELGESVGDVLASELLRYCVSQTVFYHQGDSDGLLEVLLHFEMDQTSEDLP